MEFTDSQVRRLKELGVDTPERVEAAVARLAQAVDVAGLSQSALFQRIEKQAIAATRADIADLLERRHQPSLLTLEQQISDALEGAGFTRVVTPTVISAAHLDKMSVTEDKPLRKQVFWLDDKSCLRPMLAPGLYVVSRKLMQMAPLPLRVF